MSLRAKLSIWHLKLTVKSKPLHLIDPDVLRENMDAFAPKKIPHDILMEPVEDGSVRGEWHRRADHDDERTIFYLHGGGYVFGSAKSHRKATFALAQDAQARVFSLDYRLAPEHPFPAAVDDAIAGWRWLLEQGVDPDKTVIAGDSAGGGLTLALMYAIKARGLAKPAALVTFSPWTDLTVSGQSMDENEKTDAMFKAEYIREGAKRVLHDADPRAPLASPLFADVTGYPPCLTFVSDDEVLRDDALRMHDRLIDAGVTSELVREKGLPHVWPIFVGAFPEAQAAIEKAAKFIREQT